jgi:tetratricopeptide (TPR) repeat protein
MSRIARNLTFASIIVVFLLGGALHGQTFGRVEFMVKNQDGDRVEGVKITVTCDALPSFSREKTTNKKGKATISVVDATKSYVFLFEYESFPPYTETIKPLLGQTTFREVTLTEGEPEIVEDEERLPRAHRVFNEGADALQEGNIAAAKEKFLEAAAMDEDLAPVHLALATVYAQEGSHEEVIAAANRFLEIEGENNRAYRLLYEAHKAVGNNEQADAALKAMARTDEGGDSVAMMFNEGAEALRIGDQATALARFREALELQPDLVPAISAVAMIYGQREDWEQAIAHGEQAVELEPGNVAAQRVLHAAYQALGENEKAEEAWLAVVGADPATASAEFFDRGVAHFERGETAAAKAEFEQALKVDPSNAEAQLRLGLCYVNEGNTSLAKEHLQMFLEMAPDHPESATAREMLSYMN